MLNTIIIGNKIIDARKNKNLSQTGLAQQLSISSQAVGKWERGESMPDIITFVRIAEILGVDLNYFSEDFTASPSSSKIEQTEQQTEQKKAWNMSSGVWKDADFSGIRNIDEKFNSSNIINCRFVDSDLSGMSLKGNNVINCDFSHSDLSGCSFKGSNLKISIFQNCNLKEVSFAGSNIDSCDFANADFTSTTIKNGNFMKNIITNTIWFETLFKNSSINNIVFENNITDCAFEDCRYTKVEFRNMVFNNTFFKNGNINKIKFTNCKADNLTYSFLKSGKADMSGIELQ